tara:strand:+ start:2930 stop:4183 length:1254 start_codon:yes stop_codon:yes gene_type:complete
VEGLFYLLIIVAFIFWRPILHVLFGAGKAGIQTAVSGGDFGDRWKQNVVGMGALEVRTRTLPPAEEGAPPLIEVQARGLFPVGQQKNVMFLTSVRDETDPDNPKAILSRIDDFSEPLTVAYQFASTSFIAQPNYGYGDWSRVGVLVPPIMIPPFQGFRKLQVIVRLVDTENVPDIELGLHDPDGPKALATFIRHESWIFEEKGYEETARQRDRQKPLFVELAVAVAMADGSFDSSEGEVIKVWIERQLSTVPLGRREAVKGACNDALRSGFERAHQGTLSLSRVCDEILECSDLPERYEAVELCLDVMAADDRADPAELKVIRQVANVLDLDLDELKRMKDQRLVGLSSNISEDQAEHSLEELLDIDPDWPKDRVRKHLRSEFKSWNGRLNNLTDPEERKSAQRMIELISEARKKYG